MRERGGLAFVFQRGIGFWRTRLGNLRAMMADVLNINGAAGRILKVVNVYIPPVRIQQADQVGRVIRDLDKLPWGRDVIWCGDFNAHHPLQENNAVGDYLGEALADWFTDHGLVTLNDGGDTWFARREGYIATSASNLTVEPSAEAGNSTWTRLQRLLRPHSYPDRVEKTPLLQTKRQEGHTMPQKGQLGYLCIGAG